MWAANSGCQNVMRLCSKWGFTDFDTAMVWAASSSYKSTVCLLCDWAAQEIDLALTSAVEVGWEFLV